MNTTVIIPVHEYNNDISNYLSNAIDSVANQNDVNELPQIIIV